MVTFDKLVLDETDPGIVKMRAAMEEATDKCTREIAAATAKLAPPPDGFFWAWEIVEKVIDRESVKLTMQPVLRPFV